MQYNCQKYIELLKYDQSLRKQDKFLEDEDRSKYLELKNYSIQNQKLKKQLLLI